MWSIIRVFLVESFFNEDDIIDVRKSIRSGEEKFVESMFVRINVFDVDVREMFFNGIGWFISSEDIFFRCINVGSVGDKFICEF